MQQNISILEAYTAMYIFVRNYYYRLGKPAEIGNFLSDIKLIRDGKPLDVTLWLTKDGEPQDPAMWDDWLEAINSMIDTQKS